MNFFLRTQDYTDQDISVRRCFTNRVETAMLPPAPDRPVSAVRRKIHYMGLVIKKALHSGMKIRQCSTLLCSLVSSVRFCFVSAHRFR